MEKRGIIQFVGSLQGGLRVSIPGVWRGGSRALSGIGLVGLLLGGCEPQKSEKKPAPPVFLVSPQERDQLQGRLLNRLLANGRLRCPRPVLRFAAKPGRAELVIRSVVEPTGATARCFAYVERHWSDLRRAFFQEASGSQGPVAGRPLPMAKPLLKSEVRTSTSSTVKPTSYIREPDIVKSLRGVCGAVAPLLERAAQRAEACSPYLPGRRRTPKLGSVLQAHVAMVALARHRFRASPREAVWLLLHTLRFGQDLCRGGTAWIWPLVTRLGGLDVLATLGRMLAADRLSVAALQEVQTAVGQLRTHEPALPAHIEGERLVTDLERYLIPMMPRRWIPPGGSPLSATRGEKGSSRVPGRGRAFSGSIRQDLLVAWIASERYTGRLVAACRDAASGWQCLKAVRGVERHVVARRGQLRQRWRSFNQLAAGLKKGFDRATTREAAIDLLTGVNAPNTSGSLAQAAQRGFYLAALGLHVRSLLAARRRAWPSLSTVVSWSAALRGLFSGAPPRIEVQGRGFVVRPAVSLTGAPGGAPVRYVIPGPAAASPPRLRSPGTGGRDGNGARAAPRPRTRGTAGRGSPR
jgi:hypothetical protein